MVSLNGNALLNSEPAWLWACKTTWGLVQEWHKRAGGEDHILLTSQEKLLSVLFFKGPLGAVFLRESLSPCLHLGCFLLTSTVALSAFLTHPPPTCRGFQVSRADRWAFQAQIFHTDVYGTQLLTGSFGLQYTDRHFVLCCIWLQEALTNVYI